MHAAASMPAHVAAALGRVDCLDLLLKADPLAASDLNQEGWSPLLYAASSGNGEVAPVGLALLPVACNA